MEDILSEIIANKRKEVDLQKQAISIEQLSEGIGALLPTRSMRMPLPVLRLFPFLQMKYFLAVPCGTSAQYAL